MTDHGSSRREFLAEVGKGMLVASLGSAVALDRWGPSRTRPLLPRWAGTNEAPLARISHRHRREVP